MKNNIATGFVFLAIIGFLLKGCSAALDYIFHGFSSFINLIGSGMTSLYEIIKNLLPSFLSQKDEYVILFIVIFIFVVLMFASYVSCKFKSKNTTTEELNKENKKNTIILSESEYRKKQNYNENMSFHAENSLQEEVKFLSMQFEKNTERIKELEHQLRDCKSRKNECEEKNMDLQNKIDKLDNKNKEQDEIIRELNYNLNEYKNVKEKYKEIIDAREEASRILSEADECVKNINCEIEKIAQKKQNMLLNINLEINTEYEKLKNQAQKDYEAQIQAYKESLEKQRNDLSLLKKQGNFEIEDAHKRAQALIAEAEQKASEIMGDAARFKGEISHYESIVRALKNKIEGYSDEYLIPTRTFIDDLADYFGYEDAGKKFKEAKAYSEELLKSGNAAKSDYVEHQRSFYARAFITDSFNGKVDSIISRVKNDNLGKLMQEFSDSFLQVNVYGKAFRNTRITPEYREARKEELRWAAALIGLKQKEQEEQRAIREKIQEEARAQREYERAMREAANDEAKIQKALEKARVEMAKANEAQKARYETQIDDLTRRLAEAEEKSKRARSMAEFTKAGHVYIISNVGSFGENIFKIGMTRRLEPMDRVRELGDASVPFAFDVHGMIYSENAPALENLLHRKFNDLRVNKVNSRKEFFRVKLSDIEKFAQEENLELHLTMKAMAQEYRESLALERLPQEELERRLAALLNRGHVDMLEE